MPCNTFTDEEGKVTAIVCSAPWGMGVTDYSQFEDFPEGEFQYVYGFGGSGDPHCFEPDYECNTEAELNAWEEAKANCKCGRE